MTLPKILTVPLLVAMAIGAVACSGPTTGAAAPNTVRGLVTDTHGAPLAGAKVIADVWSHNESWNAGQAYTQIDDSDRVAATGANGGYSIRLGTGGWRVYGVLERKYNGDTFILPLQSDNPQWVPGDKGGVRNFTWKLNGPVPAEQGGGFYGGVLKVVTTYQSSFRDDQYPNLQVRLEPVGPLIDGGAGQTLTLRPDRDGAMKDIPIGRYRAQVTLNGRPVSSRMDDNTSAFGASTIVDFKGKADSGWSYCTNCAQIELR